MVFFQALEGLFAIMLMVSTGYLLTAKKFFTAENSNLLPLLVNYVSLPTFMIWSMLNTFDRAKLLPLLAGVFVPAIAMLISFSISYVISNLLDLPDNRRGTFRSAFFCSSAIFVGLPVNLALYGEGSVPFVLVYFLANAFLFWTIGNYSISLSGKSAPAKLISLASLKQVFSPPFIGFTIAITLVMFGVKFSEIRLTKDLLVLLAGRFVISPLIVIAVASFFPIPELMKKVFVIQSALPAMTQTTLMARLYGADTEYAAVLVSTTTIAALFAIPIYMIVL